MIQAVVGEGVWTLAAAVERLATLMPMPAEPAALGLLFVAAGMLSFGTLGYAVVARGRRGSDGLRGDRGGEGALAVIYAGTLTAAMVLILLAMQARVEAFTIPEPRLFYLLFFIVIAATSRNAPGRVWWS